MFNGQSVLPAIKKMKDFEKILKSDYTYFVMLDLHIAQLAGVMKYVKQYDKKVFLHVDLINGLKSDRAAAEYLCQMFKPAGLISTRGDVLKTAKKNNVLAIQRLFLLDTLALETSYSLAEKVAPDLIEVLPGVLPAYLNKIHRDTGIDVVAGGLIESQTEIQLALDGGARAVTTSREALWDIKIKG